MTGEEFEAAVQRLLDQRADQGLPPEVEDQGVIDQVAAIVRNATPAVAAEQEHAA